MRLRFLLLPITLLNLFAFKEAGEEIKATQKVAEMALKNFNNNLDVFTKIIEFHVKNSGLEKDYLFCGYQYKGFETYKASPKFAKLDERQQQDLKTICPLYEKTDVLFFAQNNKSFEFLTFGYDSETSISMNVYVYSEQPLGFTNECQESDFAQTKPQGQCIIPINKHWHLRHQYRPIEVY